MIEFTILDNTGEALDYLQVPDQYHMDINLEVGTEFVYGRAPDNSYYLNHTWIEKPVKLFDHYCWDKITKQWFNPITVAMQWDTVRQQRNDLLSLSDWTQLPDAPLATKVAWITYRQQLRDITLQPDPFHIIWPTPPQG